MAAQFTEAENPTWKKKFFTIWSGQAISLIGSRLVGFALVWYLTDLTGSATVLATASLIGMLPEILLLPFAGALADRWNRRKVMIVADSGIALATLALAGLFFMGWVQIWHIYALMFVRSVCGSFHWPAMNASTSLLVPKEKYTRIQGVNQLLQGILSVVAAPLGALMMELMKVGNILMIDVITALIAVTPLFFLSIPQPDVLTQVKEGDSPLKTMLKDMREGLHYVVSWKGLFYVLIGATFINLAVNPAFSLMPLLIKNHFGLGALELGWVESTWGIGMIVGSLILTAWGGFKKKIFTSVLGLFGMGLGCILSGLVPSSAFFYFLGFSAIMGMGNPICNGPLHAIVQEVVEPGMQGRVMTLIGTFAMAASPLGYAFAGPISDWLGIQTWFIIGGVVCIIIAVSFTFLPEVVNLDQGHPNRVIKKEGEIDQPIRVQA